ncbi:MULTISPECIES: outer membrane protein assembly factor BamB family protein [Olivibacter]|uniref:PQQ-binding-like beta-propeller repeat protein n=1 Tax=Olivibacter jilunii TaxID=985016 RepID=A0ABW6B1B3_9SPHI|nr:PQQ-binding-like beta-propeller repeat protein [Olivibacter sp. UJ_SKK_5.1]MDX3916578.1 PQQ-binding-like beta-propeller repeat protein [Pseudosphingobacterium sp.]
MIPLPNHKDVALYYYILLFSCLFLTHCGKKESRKEFSTDWAFAGGDAGQQKFKKLSSINRSNVHLLREAWAYHSGDSSGNVQCNPLVIEGVMYATTPAQHLIAVNAENGKEIWRFNPARRGEKFGGINRGLACWRSKNGDDERLFYTAGGFLYAVAKETGKPVLSFGDQGRIDLNDGLVKPKEQMAITAPAAPIIFKDLVIVGTMSWSSPANVSAYDVYSGKRQWLFNTIPHPGERGYETWGDSSFYRKGAGVNAWGGLALDVENGMVYFATGQPKDDFYRGNNGGQQLFGNSVVALDAGKGNYKWHYQAIHHDLWDLDLPCAPILCMLEVKGEKVPGLIQLTKTGHVLLFNRLTGEILSKVEERPVPGSSLPGEHAYPTQPYVSWPEPFSRQIVTAEDLTDRTKEAREYAQRIFKNADAGWFVPPSEKGIIYYGIHGGAEWGGGAVDESNQLLFVNANELPWVIHMQNVNQLNNTESDRPISAGNAVYLKMGCQSCHGGERKGQGGIPALTNLSKKYDQKGLSEIIRSGKNAMPAFAQIEEKDMQDLTSFLLDRQQQNLLSDKKQLIFRSLGYVKFLDPNGYPAVKPPWGTLNAVDLRSGKIKWKVPLGEYPELTAAGFPITGRENFGGCIATAGGLVFVAATGDEKLRAFDRDTGKLLWETKLPFGGYTTPSTYEVKGKQYVLIPATGGGKLGGKTGDVYIAYTLP